MPAAILALSLVLISLPVAFAAASLGGVVLLAFSMAVLCVASPLFYLKYQNFGTQGHNIPVAWHVVICIFLVAGVLKFGGQSLGTWGLEISPLGHHARNEGVHLLKLAAESSPEKGNIYQSEIQRFLVINRNWLPSSSYLWHSSLGNQLKVQQSRSKAAYAKVQEIKSSYVQAHPVGKIVHIRDNRAVGVNYSRTYQRLQPTSSSLIAVEGNDNVLLAVFLTAVNTGESEGNMSWSSFVLYDTNGNHYSTISDSSLALEKWRSSNGSFDEDRNLKPGEAVLMSQVFRVPKSAKILLLRVNSERFRISDMPP